jgi:hypothetical protein
MEKKLATSGWLAFFEKIARAHPLIYIFLRSLVRFTNIFERDFDGVKLLNFEGKVNLIDVGASDGIAIKFLNKNLRCNKILCFEPNPSYVALLKKSNIRNLIIKDRFNFRNNKNKEIANLEKIFLGIREFHPNSEIFFIFLPTYNNYNKIIKRKFILWKYEFAFF